MTQLRDGSTVEDRRLDWIPRKDERSRGFGVVQRLQAQETPLLFRSRSWPAGPVTDQGREGACVGHGWTGFLTARRYARKLAAPAQYALDLYHVIQHRDPWQGCALGPRCTFQPSPEQYDGTSTLDGAKELKDRGEISEYRWAFGLDEVVLAIGHVGPVVLGTAWHEGMYEAPGGLLTVSGPKVGGHCYMLRGVRLIWKPNTPRTSVLEHADLDASWGTVRNSWGADWGIGGDARLSLRQLHELLQDDGEACVGIKTPQH